MSVRWLAACLVAVAGLTQAADAVDGDDWPRSFRSEAGQVLVHHPQVSDWAQFRRLEGKIIADVQPAGEGRYSASVDFSVDTRVALPSRDVQLRNAQIANMSFNPEASPAARRLLEDALSQGAGSVKLDFLLRSLPEDFEAPASSRTVTQVNLKAPRIEIVKEPRRLVLIDGPPAYTAIKATNLEFVVNSDWMIFRDASETRWFILDEKSWYENNMLASGEWKHTTSLTPELLNLRFNSNWAQVAAAIPPSPGGPAELPLLISYEPTELVVVDGEPQWQRVKGTALEFVANSKSDLFHFDGMHYLLIAGRWYQAKQLDRQWTAVERLPEAFSDIPEDHPRGYVRAAVPGTNEARLASIEATIPRRAVVKSSGGSEIQVPWAGNPEFVPIEGTQLSRASNTPFQIIGHNNRYYLCHEAAWYASSNPQGPWKAATQLPEEIYTIPPSDPAYNVTFVKVDAFDDSTGEVAYYSTSGYYGRYWTGSAVVYGTGWYHPGYYNRHAYWGHPYGWGPYYSYGYPYYYNYSETFEVNRPDKDWEWDLQGGKRTVYRQPANAVGGYYDEGDSDMGEEPNGLLQPAPNQSADWFTGLDGGIYRRVGPQWQKQQGNQWVIQQKGMISHDLDQQWRTRQMAYRSYDR